MTGRPAPALEALQSAVDHRVASLRHIRVNRLNASAWQQADTRWFQTLDRAGILAAPEVSAMLDRYIEARDRVLGSAGRSSDARTGARAKWSRNRLPLSGRKLAATETLWQVAGFILRRRFQVRKVRQYAEL
jgi:hypothetical protein